MPRRSWYRRRLSGSLLARGLGADKASSDEQSWCEWWTAVARQYGEQRAVDLRSSLSIKPGNRRTTNIRWFYHSRPTMVALIKPNPEVYVSKIK
ncbi:hypothetical protein DPMN_010568 [Dreissena polymorpha]|uniref:Uncharacterized protein n=2 Tax=Dreissena polymorpha TaxID=45954 RepID=A0A9D4N4F8_DREPO|nr:hypothetical protein DPMN_010568 [Dreissena polymorpha]